MTTTTQLPGLGHYTYSATLTDFVAGYLNDFAYEFDIPAIVEDFRDALNELLAPHGITMHGDDFYSELPVHPEPRKVIRAALAEVGLGGIVQHHELPG